MRGTQPVVPADKRAIVALSRGGAQRLPGSDVEALGKYGTCLLYTSRCV